MKYIYIGIKRSFWKLFLAFSILSLSLNAKAQDRTERVKAKYHKYLQEAEESYQAYDLEKAMDLLEKYDKKLRQSRIKSREEVALLKDQISLASRLLEYAQKIEVIDSIQLSWLDMEAWIADLSPSLSEKIDFELDSNQDVRIHYHCSENAMSLMVREHKKNLDIQQKLELLDEEKETSFISSSVNTENSENAPFLMPNGCVLLFSRKSAEGLGGYDLYYARVDAEKNEYFKAKMLGIPFSSPYNDYLLAYDDEQGLVYLLSDRYCKEGEVALYRIKTLPSELQGEAMANASLGTMVRDNSEDIYLPIKGEVVIRDWSDFKSSEAKSMYRDVLSAERRLRAFETEQLEIKKAYVNGDKSGVDRLSELTKEMAQLKIFIKERLVEVKNKELSFR